MKKILKAELSKDEKFLKRCYLEARSSKDPSTKVGAIIVKKDVQISSGYNNFPRRVIDFEERYLDRNIKNEFVVHAEHNAILNAARTGNSTIDCVMYCMGVPCLQCSKAIIQAGIVEIVFHKNWPNLYYCENWKDSISKSLIVLKEAFVKLRSVDVLLNEECLIGGKKYVC